MLQRRHSHGSVRLISSAISWSLFKDSCPDVSSSWGKVARSSLCRTGPMMVQVCFLHNNKLCGFSVFFLSERRVAAAAVGGEVCGSVSMTLQFEKFMINGFVKELYEPQAWAFIPTHRNTVMIHVELRLSFAKLSSRTVGGLITSVSNSYLHDLQWRGRGPVLCSFVFVRCWALWSSCYQPFGAVEMSSVGYLTLSPSHEPSSLVIQTFVVWRTLHTKVWGFTVEADSWLLRRF